MVPVLDQYVLVLERFSRTGLESRLFYLQQYFVQNLGTCQLVRSNFDEAHLCEQRVMLPSRELRGVWPHERYRSVAPLRDYW